MPIKVTALSGAGKDYGNPFVGPINHTLGISVDLTLMTNKEIDSKGYLKAGIPLNRSGKLVNAVASSLAAAVAGTNTGGGTVGSLTGRVGAPTETITLVCTATASGAGTFSVTGSVSGLLGYATVGVLFSSSVCGLLISDGTPDFALNDSFTIAATAGASGKVFGVTVEPIPVATANDNTTIAALGTVEVAVATICMVNRDIIEDILERSLTADEVAGFEGGSCVLTNT